MWRGGNLDATNYARTTRSTAHVRTRFIASSFHTLETLSESQSGDSGIIPTLPCGVTERACLRHATVAVGVAANIAVGLRYYHSLNACLLHGVRRDESRLYSRKHIIISNLFFILGCRDVACRVRNQHVCCICVCSAIVSRQPKCVCFSCLRV